MWRNNVGVDTARGVRYGLGNGSPDLVGFLLGGSARWFCLEVKSETGRESVDQRQWHAWARTHGLFVATVRSREEAMAALERAEQGAIQ